MVEFKGIPEAGLKTVETEGGEVVRRSNRRKIQPLEYWRNERIVYGRRKSGFCPVPVVKEVIRVPIDEGSDSDSTSGARKKRQRPSNKRPPPNPLVKFNDIRSGNETEKGAIAFMDCI